VLSAECRTGASVPQDEIDSPQRRYFGAVGLAEADGAVVAFGVALGEAAGVAALVAGVAAGVAIGDAAGVAAGGPVGAAVADVEADGVAVGAAAVPAGNAALGESEPGVKALGLIPS